MSLKGLRQNSICNPLSGSELRQKVGSFQFSPSPICRHFLRPPQLDSEVGPFQSQA